MFTGRTPCLEMTADCGEQATTWPDMTPSRPN
jgi:hypothetical protein